MASASLLDQVAEKSLAHHLPLNVHFDLTYRCNERCIHCYLDHEDYGELTGAEVKGILDQLARAGTLFLTFSGGEVFLRHDFFDLVAYAKKLHFDLSLKTNALLINEGRAGRLKALGVSKVQVSIYSADPRIHDAVTKIPGSFARSLQAIRFLKEQGLQVKIACPLMKLNAEGLPAVQALAEELDVPYILDLTITPRMDGDLTPVALRIDKKELLPVLNNRRLRAQQAAASELPSEAAESPPDPYADIPCSAGHNSCYLSPYGDVYPCVQMPVPTGNLREQPFEEIWYGSPQMLRVRSVRENQLHTCSSCGLRSSCSRCPGLAYVEDGDLRGPSRTACELAELRASLAGVPNPVSVARSQPAWRVT
ncbi:MAG: radical SAM/SPASM domain-containing protein [Terriglobia bacterium]